VKGGFQNEGAARPHQRPRPGESFRRAGRIHDEIEPPRQRLHGVDARCVQAELRAQCSRRITSHEDNGIGTPFAEDLRDEQPQSARADHGRSRAAIDWHLIHDAIGGSRWLDE